MPPRHTSIVHKHAGDNSQQPIADSQNMNILVIDIGGTNVKIWTTGETEKLKFPSGKSLTPQHLIEKIKEAASDWHIDRVSIGYPGEVRTGQPVADPFNL